MLPKGEGVGEWGEKGWEGGRGSGGKRGEGGGGEILSGRISFEFIELPNSQKSLRYQNCELLTRGI